MRSVSCIFSIRLEACSVISDSCLADVFFPPGLFSCSCRIKGSYNHCSLATEPSKPAISITDHPQKPDCGWKRTNLSALRDFQVICFHCQLKWITILFYFYLAEAKMLMITNEESTRNICTWSSTFLAPLCKLQLIKHLFVSQWNFLMKLISWTDIKNHWWGTRLNVEETKTQSDSVI